MADGGNKAEISSSLNSPSSHPEKDEGNKAETYISVEDQGSSSAQAPSARNPPEPSADRPQRRFAPLVELCSASPSPFEAVLCSAGPKWHPHTQSTLEHAHPTFAQGMANADHKAKSPRLDPKARLLKVPRQLRQVNENAYEPQIVSIGLDYDNTHLTEMEVFKEWYLTRIRDKKGKEKVDSCVAMRIEEAQKWYSQSSSSRYMVKELERMLLRDGCFLVELLCGRAEEIDPIFKLKWVRNALLHDMLLLENQLPFFVLVDLFRMIEDSPRDGEDFASRAFSVLSKFLPGPKKWIENLPTIRDTDNIKHLLSLVHDNWSPSPQGIMRHQEYHRTTKEREMTGDIERGVTNGEHSCFKWNFICRAREKENVGKELLEWQSIRCATELAEAGIQFVNSTEDRNVKSLFDISFTNGVMKIPTLVIDDHTEHLFRNLIAYEQYAEGSTYVIDYVMLMDNLINSARDVQLLRFEGIIENMLGDDEAVAKMINKLRDHVALCGKTFYYEEIFADVKKHCKRRWPTWRANLLHNYFNSPWALISFLAATLIILLTITQTVFTGIQTFK